MDKIDKSIAISEKSIKSLKQNEAQKLLGTRDERDKYSPNSLEEFRQSII